MFQFLQECKQFEILECLQFGKRSMKYTTNVRIFCFTLHFYSPKAYEYMRTTFSLNLPHIRTIRDWYSVIDGSPGFTESAFSALKQKSNDSIAGGKPLIVSLIHDDMAIRKHSQWNAAEQKVLGHITAGKPGEYEVCSPLAKESSVLMVSGIGTEFKMPIGYFLIKGLCAEERAAILNEALYKLNSIGVLVAAITSDGYIVNLSTANILGADFEAEKPYFVNPFNKKYIIYIILDPPHMLKLARNCLANKGTIFDGTDHKILWKFLTNLVSLQISENVNFGNKLSKTHVEYESKKMNVRIAAETLSNSVATSIEYLNTVLENENFRGSEATVQYFRVFNNLFDIMNTKRDHCGGEYKQPISEVTIDSFRDYFEFAKNYIKGLKLIENGKKKPILKSKSFTPYCGYYHNMASFLGIYNDYLKPVGISEFYTFDVSQDHLESFFGCIRRMGGK